MIKILITGDEGDGHDTYAALIDSMLKDAGADIQREIGTNYMTGDLHNVRDEVVGIGIVVNDSGDEWMELIESHGLPAEFYTSRDILKGVIGFEVDVYHAETILRLSKIMRDLGWEVGKTEKDGKWRTGWKKS